MTMEEEVEAMDLKIRFILSKKGVEEPNVDAYEHTQMRHYYAAKKRYKQQYDLFHNEVMSGRIEI